LLIVAVAVYIFIYWGNINESYSKLLKIDDYSKKKEEPRVIQAVASIIWPLATCVFLVSGFFFDKWHIGWIVFPITGILFGMFSSAYKILKGQK
jgi:fatty acid desaturase